MENLQTEDSFLTGKQIVLALSGGIDSVVLLHYLHTYYPNNLRAVYCNHQLSEHANDWGAFCANLCKTLQINYTSLKIVVDTSSNIEENAHKNINNLEEKARIARYHALSSKLKENEVLCTAHHQNDQAETLLLQLFRGSGTAGLAAMPKRKPLGKGTHYRPLLNIDKSQIITYAQQHALDWVEDESNQNTDFKRNFLRLNILPKLAESTQNLTQTLGRSAQHQAESLALLRELATLDINNHQLINAHNHLNITKLRQLEAHRIKNVLRFHLSALGFLMPSDKVLAQIVNMLNAKEDANPLVSWSTYEVRSYQDALHFIDNSADKKPVVCPFYDALKDLPNFAIGYRNGGERVRLAGKTHSQSLKKILQAANIPPWERNLLRMYYVNNTLRAMESIGEMAQANKD